MDHHINKTCIYCTQELTLQLTVRARVQDGYHCISPKGKTPDKLPSTIFDKLQTLIIPAIISLLLYLIISYVLVPIWRRYRARYSQYLPLESISTQTTTFRQRVQGVFARYLLPSSWRSDFGSNRYAVSAADGLVDEFDDEEGEELSDVDDNRRLALSLDARRGLVDDRRLSRDLEEGFRDDSDEE